MSPFEINVLRFIFTLDNILVTLMPWFKVLTIAAIMAFVALLGRRIIRRKARPAQYGKDHIVQ